MGAYYNVMMQLEITAVGEDVDLEELLFSTSGTDDDKIKNRNKFLPPFIDE